MAATFSLSGLLRLVPRWVDDLTATAITDTATVSELLSLADGAGAGEANAYWRDLISIAAGSAATIDLFAMPTTVFGGTGSIALYKIKTLLVVNRSAAAAVSFGAASASRWSGYSAGAISLPAGAMLFAMNAADGWPAGATSRMIVIENESATGAASIDVYIAGVLD